MEINNFEIIEEFLEFVPGTFYKFECLVRNTDGNNPLYEQGMSNTNKNILIKSWYVDTAEYYERIKKEMITLSNLTGGRIYITLDRKSTLKLITNLSTSITQTMVNCLEGRQPGIKSLSKLFASNTSIVESSDKSRKTIMFDLDCKDLNIVTGVKSYIQNHGCLPYILNTKKGYHIFCFKKFDTGNWIQEITTITGYSQDVIQEALSVKPNELGLVYHPMRENK